MSNDLEYTIENLEQTLFFQLHEREPQRSDAIKKAYQSESYQSFSSFLQAQNKTSDGLLPAHHSSLLELRLLKSLFFSDQKGKSKSHSSSLLRSLGIGGLWGSMYYLSVVDPLIGDASNMHQLPATIIGSVLLGVSEYYFSVKRKRNSTQPNPSTDNTSLDELVHSYEDISKSHIHDTGHRLIHKYPRLSAFGAATAINALPIREYISYASELSQNVSQFAQATIGLGLHISLYAALLAFGYDLVSFLGTKKRQVSVRDSLEGNHVRRQYKRLSQKLDSSSTTKQKARERYLNLYTNAYENNPLDYGLLTDLTDDHLEHGEYHEALHLLKTSLYFLSRTKEKDFEKYATLRYIERDLAIREFSKQYVSPALHTNQSWTETTPSETTLFKAYLPLARGFLGNHELQKARMIFDFLKTQIHSEEYSFGLSYLSLLCSEHERTSYEQLFSEDASITQLFSQEPQEMGCKEVELHDFSRHHLLLKRYANVSDAIFEESTIDMIASFVEGDLYSVSDVLSLGKTHAVRILDREKGVTLYELLQENHPNLDTFMRRSAYALSFIHSMYQTEQPALDIPKRLYDKYTGKSLLTDGELEDVCEAFHDIDARRLSGDLVFDKDSHPENIVVSYPDSDDSRVTIIDFEDRKYRVKAYDDLSNLVSFGQDLSVRSVYCRFEETIRSYYQFTRYMQEQATNTVLLDPLGDIDENCFFANTLNGVIYRAFCLYDSLRNRRDRYDVRDTMLTNALVAGETVLNRYSRYSHTYQRPLQELVGVLSSMKERT